MKGTRAEFAALVNDKLEELLPREERMQEVLFDAMRYSLLAGGKRIRPVLTLAFCALCGGDVRTALPYACAVEMVHTYSLIHDDLPCMDNDDLRRGRPSNHRQFGEDTALLAGDALLTLAFETMLDPAAVAAVGAERAAAAAFALAHAAGGQGMVGGQVIDLASEDQDIPLETLRTLDDHKTGDLIAAAARMGCLLAGADQARLEAAERYSRALGLAFQICDDILDITGDPSVLGKPVGSDEENQKSTYVKLLGMERAKSFVELLTQEALDALEAFPAGTEELHSLALELARREA